MRGHNEGSLFRMASGRFAAEVGLPGGRRSRRQCPHRHDPGARPCPESRALLRGLLRDRDDGLVDGRRTTVSAYLRSWVQTVRPDLAPATWAKYEQHVRLHLEPALGRHRLADLAPSHVDAYLRRADLDPQTLRHHRATLSTALRAAQRDGLVRVNAAALSRPPKLRQRERPVLTAEQARALIAGLAGDPSADPPVKPDRLRALWILLVTTGLREAEALALTWEDVDLGLGRGAPVHGVGDMPDLSGSLPARHGEAAEAAAQSLPQATAAPSVTVRHTLHRVDGQWQRRAPKTEKSARTVVLTPQAADALRDHRRAQLEAWMAAGRPGELGLVFTTPSGRPMHGANLAKELRRHTARLGLPDVTPHGLRHSSATILYGAGVDLATIADMLGHSTIRVTADLYRHRVETAQSEAADAMGRALG